MERFVNLVNFVNLVKLVDLVNFVNLVKLVNLVNFANLVYLVSDDVFWSLEPWEGLQEREIQFSVQT